LKSLIKVDREMIKLFKQQIKKISSSLLKRYGYDLIAHSELKSLADFSFNILQVAEEKNNNNRIDSIVFSKDRAMQLHAFLLSYTERVDNRKRMYVLYKCSNDRHKKSYEQLKAIFISEDFVFIEEHYFREQLIEILEKSEAGKILFYVDDMIFTHKINYEVFENIDTTSSVLSLSRGKDFDYSTVLLKTLVQPPFTRQKNNLEQFNWNFSDIYSDWTYPLGVSAYMFGKVEITAMLKAVSFKAPNSLEQAMQTFLMNFINRYGLCMEFATCVCVHANMVQTEGRNPVLGTFSIDQLLNLWESGKRIKIDEFYDKPIRVTQVQKYTFL
jgi:hypothetical protein